jgi:hypothetical protein
LTLFGGGGGGFFLAPGGGGGGGCFLVLLRLYAFARALLLDDLETTRLVVDPIDLAGDSDLS